MKGGELKWYRPFLRHTTKTACKWCKNMPTFAAFSMHLIEEKCRKTACMHENCLSVALDVDQTLKKENEHKQGVAPVANNFVMLLLKGICWKKATNKSSARVVSAQEQEGIAFIVVSTASEQQVLHLHQLKRDWMPLQAWWWSQNRPSKRLWPVYTAMRILWRRKDFLG